MEKKKDDVIRDDVIDAIITTISNIRSKYPQKSYAAIKECGGSKEIGQMVG